MHLFEARNTFDPDGRVSSRRIPGVFVMELRYSVTSPYARKVRVIAHELGITDKIQMIKTDPRGDAAVLVPLNPLSKIPALNTDSGEVLYDSPVICEFLDAEHGGNRYFPA